MRNTEWKLPLNLAVGLHVLLVLLSVYLPGIFRTKPIIPENYTVNIVSISESGPKAGGAPKQEPAKQEPAPKKVEAANPEVKIKPVEIKQPPPPEPVVRPKVAPAPIVPPAPVNAISLKPLKRKIERDVVDDTLINERIRKLEIQQQREQEVERKREQELERKKKLETLQKERVADAVRAEKAAEDAREAAEELKQLLHSATSGKNTIKEATGTQSGGGEGSGENTNARSGDNTSGAEKLYQAAIYKRLQQFWALPEFKKWDPSLTAVVVITISTDGAITNQYFEKRSGDSVFDQFVEKTLHDAAPLPQIPAALRKSQYEIGLRFKPTGIQ